jgi:hypothetical protein
MKLSLILVGLIFCHFSYSQTTVIAVLEDSAIYLGADTKYSSFRDGSYGCKVFSKDSFAVGCIGALVDVQQKLIYGKRVDSLKGIIFRYEELFRDTLMYRLSKMSDRQFNFFISQPNLDHAAITVFVTYINGDPIMYVSSFAIIVNGTRFKVNINPTTYYTKYDKPQAFGKIDSFKEILWKEATWAEGAKVGIANLINMESKCHSESVGGKIDILKITRTNKVERVLSSGLCGSPSE